MFYSNGSVFDPSAMLGATFQINQTAISGAEMPHLTGSNVWYNIATFLSVGITINTLMKLQLVDS